MWACKKAIRDLVKLIAKEAKSNPKAFYNYVSSKTKTRVTVSDLINDIGSTVASNDKEKADALKVRAWYIHPRILKELPAYLLVPLRILFTRSLSEGVIPNSWKISHVIPIFKGGKRSCASNYRPVSLTCIICKMMESLIHDAIIKHLINNNLLVQCQHGLIQGRSCVTQLLKILGTWTEI